jgi:hypothetical protein
MVDTARTRDGAADTALGALIGALAPPGTPANQAWVARTVPPSPTDLLFLAKQHRVVLPVAQRLAKKAPDPWRAVFKAPVRARTLRALSLTGELSRIADGFAAAGVPLIALKGPALSQDLFGTPIARDPGDLDLLVKAQDLLRADTLLRQQGYLRGSTWDEGFATGNVKIIIDKSFRNGHINYHLPNTHISVELHWRWFHVEEVVPFDEALVWQETRTVQIGSCEISVFSPSILLIYLSLHAAAHDCERLMWIYDIVWLLPRLNAGDLIKARNLAQHLGILDLVLAPLLCAATLGATVLPPVLADLSERRSAHRLALFCHFRLEHPVQHVKSGFHYRSLCWRRYWRFASDREPPRRLFLAKYFVRVLCSVLTGWLVRMVSTKKRA